MNNSRKLKRKECFSINTMRLTLPVIKKQKHYKKSIDQYPSQT